MVIAMDKIKQIIAKIFNKNNFACSIGIIGAADGPTSIFTAKTNMEKRRKFNEWLDNAAKQIKPCGKTIEELESYLIEKYNAEKVEVSDFHAKIIKTNIIMNFFPELLTTPITKFEGNKKPTKKQMREFAENSEKRHNEAMEYPLDKLNLDICVYEFPYVCENQEIGTFRINIERSTNQCNVGFVGNVSLSDEQKETINNIIRDIDLFKGVTQEDIDNHTPRFMGYATSLLNYNED